MYMYYMYIIYICKKYISCILYIYIYIHIHIIGIYSIYHVDPCGLGQNSMTWRTTFFFNV